MIVNTSPPSPADHFALDQLELLDVNKRVDDENHRWRGGQLRCTSSCSGLEDLSVVVISCPA